MAASPDWTERDMRTLRRLRKAGASTADMAAALGRSQRGVQRKLQRMRSAGTLAEPTRNHGRQWSEDDDDRLITLVEQGMRWPAIAMRLGREEQNCRARWVKLLTRPVMRWDRPVVRPGEAASLWRAAMDNTRMTGIGNDQS